MSKIKPYLKRLNKSKVLVVGDLILDHYIWGKVDRISPEAPVPVVKVTKESFMAGGCANVALNVRALNGYVAICGLVGKDQFGKSLLSLLKKNQIDFSGVFIDETRQTIRKTRVIANHQHIVRVDREDVSIINSAILDKMRDYLIKIMRDFNVVIVSDYAKGFINKSLIDILKDSFCKKDVFFIADPKVKNISLFRGFDLVTPNRKEAMEAAALNDEGKENDIIKAGKKLIKTYKFKSLLITRGEEGMSLFSENNHFRIPTFAQEVFDVTGAGDTVIATVGAGLSAGLPLLQSCIISNIAASVVVGKVGTATATVAEIEDKWAKLDNTIKKQLEKYL